MNIDHSLASADLAAPVKRVFQAAIPKIRALRNRWKPESGAPVFTWEGRYTARGWTEWTQGFQYGCALLTYEATGERSLFEQARRDTVELMAGHITHEGVHDHGFNNVSTYGNLLRIGKEEGSLSEWEREFYVLALKLSGAVQAARWTDLPGGLGYIQSFNGPHSLFADTIRSLRALAMGHQFGHVLMSEQDRKISLLVRLLQHAEATARFNVYFGEGRDAYDEPGRVAHESIFNTHNGSYRCASTQQGYSAFSTWTRGHAWILCGYPEQLEFLNELPEETPEFGDFGGKQAVLDRYERTARAVADFYIAQTPLDGVPYWDTGAPGLAKMGDYLSRPGDPYNEHEPVDSSAAAIGAQGLYRLGRYLAVKGDVSGGSKYQRAALTVARTIFSAPYLSEDPNHEGLLLHSVYHRPNGWDRIPPGRSVPCDEACMWGDYHALELALLILREADQKPYLTFFS